MKKVFCSEYMRKSRPNVPRGLCSSYENYLLGILSPSLCWVDKNGEYADFVEQTLKYLCYTRKLDKSGWEKLYRKVRKETVVLKQ